MNPPEMEYLHWCRSCQTLYVYDTAAERLTNATDHTNDHTQEMSHA